MGRYVGVKGNSFYQCYKNVFKIPYSRGEKVKRRNYGKTTESSFWANMIRNDVYSFRFDKSQRGFYDKSIRSVLIHEKSNCDFIYYYFLW